MQNWIKKVGLLVGVGSLSAVSVLATYTENYTAAELVKIVTDLLGEAGVQVYAFMALIVLVALFVWVRKKKLVKF